VPKCHIYSGATQHGSPQLDASNRRISRIEIGARVTCDTGTRGATYNVSQTVNISGVGQDVANTIKKAMAQRCEDLIRKLKAAEREDFRRAIGQ
jgi:hypothetical protein